MILCATSDSDFEVDNHYVIIDVEPSLDLGLAMWQREDVLHDLPQVNVRRVLVKPLPIELIKPHGLKN